MTKKKNATSLITNINERTKVANHVEALDNVKGADGKIKSIVYFPGEFFVGVAEAAYFYEVSRETLKSVIKNNREELTADGLLTINGDELKNYKAMAKEADLKNSAGEAFFGAQCSSYTIVPRRVLLKIGMLLEKSKVAEQVRDYLANVEESVEVTVKKVAAEKAVKQTAKKTSNKKVVATVKSPMEVSNELQIKILRAEARETKKNIVINAAIEKCMTYGLTREQASVLIQKAVVDKKNLNTEILAEVERLSNLQTQKQRGSIREMLTHIVNVYSDGTTEDYEDFYHMLSEKLRYKIGVNLQTVRTQAEAKREKVKAENAKLAKGTKKKKLPEIPSYLDLIIKYNAVNEAVDCINEIVAEKESIKNFTVKETIQEPAQA